MLSRFAELRDLAQAPAPEPNDAEKTTGQKEEILDDDYAEMVAEMQLQYKEILEDEGVAIQAFEEVRLRVESMEELVQLQKEALLPSKLQQLANRFEGQELVCQRMIRRAKEALVTLRAEDADVDEDDSIHIALAPIRKNIAMVRGKQFKALVQGFFTARAHNREEMLIRATRQLRYAYPDALDEELNDILEFPELAAVAISQRLEKGADGVTLDGILAEMEGKKADAKKLEQGAKELKLMFLQFAELIDNQGENLTAIEANIKTVMEETTEAIDNLLDAEAEKRAYERKWMKFYIIAFLFLCWLIFWPLYKDVFRGEEKQKDRDMSWGRYVYTGTRDALVGTKNLFVSEERAIEKAIEKKGGEGDKEGADKGADKEADKGADKGANKGSEGSGIGQSLVNAAHSVGGAMSSATNAAYNMVAGKKSGAASSLVQVAQHQEAFVLEERYAHDRLNESVATEIRKSAGFFAPRASSRAQGEIAEELPLQALAVTARGGAARHSALRKKHLSPQD